MPIARRLPSIQLAALSCLFLTGCLTDSYAIRHDELVRIAALPPENRGTHVRATQQTSFSDSYEEPDPLPPASDGPSGVVIVTGPHYYHHHSHPGAVSAPVGARRQPARQSGSGGGFSPRAGSGGGSASVGKGNDADIAATLAIAALVVGTGAFSIAAMTEGPRFDGWVWVPPEQQLLLKPKNMAPYWLPLVDLTPEDVANTDGAELRPAKAQLLERAPLDRVGLTTSLELGGAGMRTTSSGNPGGFMGRYGLGGFPVQWLGLLGNAGFSVGDDEGTLFDGRLGLELRLLPLHVGRVHLGGYGEIGHSWLMHDIPGGTAKGQGAYYGAGGLLELDITTRLGLLLRAGAAWLPHYDRVLSGPDDQRPFAQFSLGLGVY